MAGIMTVNLFGKTLGIDIVGINNEFDHVSFNATAKYGTGNTNKRGRAIECVALMFKVEPF